MIKIADSATMKHAIPTVPRYGSVHAISTAPSIGIVLAVFIIRSPRLDLQDVSDPTVVGGCSPSAQRQSYTKAAEKSSPTPASTHPTGRGRLLCHGSTTTPGYRRSRGQPLLGR